MDYKRIERQQKYLKLPEQLKEAIFSVKNAEQIQAIAQKYHLQTEKMQCLAKTAGLVLLGEIPMDQFESEIQKQCGFIPESARDISQDVYQNIFKPTKQYLIKPNQPISLPQGPEHDTIKQELADHGVEIRTPKNNHAISSPPIY